MLRNIESPLVGLRSKTSLYTHDLPVGLDARQRVLTAVAGVQRARNCFGEFARRPCCGEEPGLRACLEIESWVAQATGLCRPATRRTEWAGHRRLMRTAESSGQPGSFRSAGRRPERAGRPCYPFFKHALRDQSLLTSAATWSPLRFSGRRMAFQ